MNQAASIAERLRRRHSITLPEDFERYLSERAPVEDEWDDNGMIWWGLGRIQSLIDECPEATPPDQLNSQIDRESSTYIVFADYMDWCYAYAICCSDGPNRGRVALIGGRPDGFVAESFSEFRVLAAADSDRLHKPTDDTRRPSHSAT